MSDIRIELPTTNYQTGNTVSGQLICNFRSEKECRRIYVRFKCNEHTSWTDTESYYDSELKKHRSRTIHCTGDNTIYFRETIVHKGGTVPPGKHVFQFNYPIPDNLPSTFSCTEGYIQYVVEAVVDRPFKIDFTDTKYLQVSSPIRLDKLHSDLRGPGEWADDKTVCCWCCASGPVELEVYLDKQAFVVGESFNARVYCKNMSNVNVDELTAKITQTLNYKTTSPVRHKSDSFTITELSKPGVGAHGDREYDIQVQIPADLVLHNFESCTLFKTDSNFEIEASLDGCHSSLSIYPGIALGHVPFAMGNDPYTNPNMTNIAYPTQSTGPPPPAGFHPVPPPVGMPMPMPMPMPIPMMKPSEGKPFSPPYPVDGNSASPSAPANVSEPSAPPKAVLAGEGYSGDDAGAPPPPSYDEATKNLPKEEK